ncbi:MAG: hypothetical protein LBI67_12225 [Treponema sp.]|jgi:hypothetical protein|nr:hypothetical protein [Treponema sp.]
MKLEFRREGYQAIIEKIQDLENMSGSGILNPDKAAVCCREIRAGLFQLNQIIRETVMMVPAAPGPGGRDAA